MKGSPTFYTFAVSKAHFRAVASISDTLLQAPIAKREKSYNCDKQSLPAVFMPGRIVRRTLWLDPCDSNMRARFTT